MRTASDCLFPSLNPAGDLSAKSSAICVRDVQGAQQSGPPDRANAEPEAARLAYLNLSQAVTDLRSESMDQIADCELASPQNEVPGSGIALTSCSDQDCRQLFTSVPEYIRKLIDMVAANSR